MPCSKSGASTRRQEVRSAWGKYGDVSVVGKTLAEAKAAIEARLSRYLQNPEVTVDVYAYNSKVLLRDLRRRRAPASKSSRLPSTGNETGAEHGQSNQRPVRRGRQAKHLGGPPGARGHGGRSDPAGGLAPITKRGTNRTNYQLFPGDRLYVAADPLITIDTHLARIISPIGAAVRHHSARPGHGVVPENDQ